MRCCEAASYRVSDRILITQLGFLGDVILSTPVIGALRKIYPDAELTFLTTKAAAPLVEKHPELKEVLSYDKRGSEKGVGGFFNLREKLKERKFSKVFSLHRSIRTSLLHKLSGIPIRYGFSEASGAFLYTKTVTRSEYKHDVLRNLAILKNIGKDPLTVSESLRVEISSEVVAAVDKYLPQEGFIAIAPGSVWATKRWTVQGFAAVCRVLAERKMPVVLIGGPDDFLISETIERLSGSSVVNLVGKLRLIESAAVIRRAKAVISNDSAPLHLASAFKRPTVALFCATVPGFGFGPWDTISETIGMDDLPCRPCGRHGKNYCPTGTHACQVGITPARVLEALYRVMASGEG